MQMDIYLSRPHKDKVQMALEIIEYMNDVLRLDSEAILALCEHRVPCNAALTLHPTTQVGGSGDEAPPVVGMLGILNGMVGVRADGWGYICAVYDDDNKLIRFELTSEFPITDSKPPT